jgi:hypothetical protein
MGFPTPQEFFLNVGLYQSIEILDDSEARNLLSYRGALDTYCTGCRTQSTFISRDVIQNQIGIQSNTFITRKFTCSRNDSHVLYFAVYISDKTLTKVGQYPSFADLIGDNYKQYRKVIGDNRTKELKKAVGLFAHGVGIGSFVYLRRTFEYLVEVAHIQAKERAGWDEETYLRSRMDKKIELLRDLLPQTLVESRNLYSILSKGIHELSEEECLQYFPIMKSGIELIVEERLYELEMQKRTEDFKRQVNEIYQKIR